MTPEQAKAEKWMVQWGYKTVTGTLVQPNYSSPRYGQRLSTKRSGGTWMPVSWLVQIDIISRKMGTYRDLEAFYVRGWKYRTDRWGNTTLVFKPDGRRAAKAHRARDLVAAELRGEVQGDGGRAGEDAGEVSAGADAGVQCGVEPERCRQQDSGHGDDR